MARNKLFFKRKRDAADVNGEELTLTAAIRPMFRVDRDAMKNYNANADTRILMVLVWLIEKLYERNVLKAADFDDFPLLNKINGESIVIKQ